MPSQQTSNNPAAAYSRDGDVEMTDAGHIPPMGEQEAGGDPMDIDSPPESPIPEDLEDSDDSRAGPSTKKAVAAGSVGGTVTKVKVVYAAVEVLL